MANNKFQGDNEKEYQLKAVPMQQVRTATVLRALYSKRQLFEVLTDFWHNHFQRVPARSRRNLHDLSVVLHQRHPQTRARKLSPDAAGRGQQQRDANYLDNATSRDEGPNENFARELLELHTLGADNYLGVRAPASIPKDANGVAVGYVDNDVYEIARCFTGWTFDQNADWWQMTNTGVFVYRKDWHDRFNKMVLGKYLPADQADLKDGKDVLDMLANHPGTARHIATKLCAPPDQRHAAKTRDRRSGQSLSASTRGAGPAQAGRSRDRAVAGVSRHVRGKDPAAV